MFVYPFKKLLVATDFSSCSDSALELASHLALEHDGELVVVHVVEVHGVPLEARLFPASHPEGITAERYTHELASAQLARRLASVRARHRAVVVYGAPATAILEVAAQEHVDVVLMGTRGRGGMMHLLAGSVAEKVVRRSTVPVVTVREPTCRHAPIDPELDGETEG